MNKKIRIVGLSFFFFGFLHAQHKNLTIQFVPYYNNSPLVLKNNWYVTPNGDDSITIDLLKLYVGKFIFNGTNKKEVKNYYLLNAAEDSSLKIQFRLPKANVIKSLEFNVGVDSTTTLKGILNGSLDPLNGMYWTWNTGYIHTKLEGSCKNCQVFRNMFQFHIGGYKAPFNAIKKIKLPITSNNTLLSKILIKINVASWFKNIDFKGQVSIMQPNAKAMQLADNFTNSFSIISYH